MTKTNQPMIEFITDTLIPVLRADKTALIEQFVVNQDEEIAITEQIEAIQQELDYTYRLLSRLQASDCYQTNPPVHKVSVTLTIRDCDMINLKQELDEWNSGRQPIGWIPYTLANMIEQAIIGRYTPR